MLASCLTVGGEDVDVVVKLNGFMDFGTRAAVFELIGALIASKLGIDSPRPFLVWLSKEFVDAVSLREPSKAIQLGQCQGWNFGSEMLKDATILASGAPIPSGMLVDALKIFAFDGLTQNADRGLNNPNLFMRSDKLTVIDHECSFSFLSSFIPSSKPWTMGTGDFMERHALARNLRGNALDWLLCRQSLVALTSDFFDSLEEEIPLVWEGAQDLAAIKKHVLAVLEHPDLFEAELRRRIQ